MEDIVPLALVFLEKDWLCSRNLYRGDLLVALLGLSSDYWGKNAELNSQLVEIKIEIEGIYDTLSKKIMPKSSKLNYLKENDK